MNPATQEKLSQLARSALEACLGRLSAVTPGSWSVESARALPPGSPFIPAAGASAAGEFAPVTAVSHLSAESGICLVALQIDGPVPEQGLVVNGRRMDGVAEGVGS